MSGEHAILAPSSAPQWGHCSGSVSAQANALDIDTPEKREGRAAHWTGSETVANFQSNLEGLPLSTSEFIGKADPEGTVIDQKMADGAEVVVRDVLAVAQEHGALRNILVEHRVHMPQIHEENWGTLDYAIPLLDKNLIYLWDYKNGHREVSARENLQAIDYVGGLLNELKIDGHQEQFITVVIRIVHPYSYSANGPISEWRVPLTHLHGYFNQLHAKAQEVFSNPTLSTGPWCRDCTAVGTCSAARRAGYNFVDYVNSPYQMDSMDPRSLAVERRIVLNGIEAAKGRLGAIEDELTQRLNNGKAAESGMTLEGAYGNLEWTIPAPQAIALAGQFGANIANNNVKTPTQAKDEVPREMRQQFEQVLKTVTRRPSRGLKLVDVSDSVAAHAFKKRN